ncbi:type II secretion system protein J [Bdellovibrio sp. HCB209]|uniref:PulJ/GspJ family protein n=1 Tax=Bdellovibrio sp. HCB209 TaxID=3394354 RepID=UPI0039B5CA2F
MNRRGFTLIQIMVSIGLTSIIMLILSSFAADSFKYVNGMKRSLDMEDTVATVRRSLAKNNECTLNLGNKGIKLVSGEQGTLIEGFSNHEKNGAEISSIIKSGDTDRGVKLSRIQLRKVAAIAPDVNVANLVFTFDKGSGKVASREKIIPLVVKEKGGVITECWTREFTPRYVLDLICRQANGIDEIFIFEECKAVQSKWYTGTLYLAQCPSGTSPRPSPDILDCRAEGYLPNSMDYMVKAPSTSGGTLDVSRPPAIIQYNTATRSCICAYAGDLAIPNAKCAIRCYDD